MLRNAGKKFRYLNVEPLYVKEGRPKVPLP